MSDRSALGPGPGLLLRTAQKSALRSGVPARQAPSRSRLSRFLGYRLRFHHHMFHANFGRLDRAAGLCRSSGVLGSGMDRWACCPDVWFACRRQSLLCRVRALLHQRGSYASTLKDQGNHANKQLPVACRSQAAMPRSIKKLRIFAAATCAAVQVAVLVPILLLLLLVPLIPPARASV